MESTVDRLYEDSSIPPEDLFAAPDFAKRAPRNVAILPPDNATEDTEASEIVRRLFYGNFSPLPFRDVEPALVDRALEEDAGASLADLSKKLGADGFIKGKVLRFERSYYGVYANIYAEVEFELIDAKSGDVLWKVKAEEDNQNVSLSLSPLGIAVGMAGNAFEVSRLALLNTANKACRRAAASIPVPQTMGRRPRIEELLHNGVGKILKSGDKLQVAVRGTPGLEAWFSAPGVRKDVQMVEDSADTGAYSGNLLIPDGLEISGVVLEARLTNDRGEAVNWIDALGPVQIDSKPPEPPENLAALPGDRNAEISWLEGNEADLALYRVFRSNEPLQGYENVAETQRPDFKNENLDNDRSYFYKIAAVDKAGNQSVFSARAEVVPVAPGPRKVSGELPEKAFWPRAGGPYVLHGEVIIQAGAKLTIEAGTQIIAMPQSSLRVEGGLDAAGVAEKRISFKGKDGAQWKGIAVSGPAAEASLIYVNIENAEQGLSIKDASPRIERTRISNCNLGVSVEGPEAAPRLIRALIHGNRGPGLKSSSLAAPTVSMSKILQNKGPGVLLSGGGGVLFDNEISANQEGGITGNASTLKLGYNRIHANEKFELNLSGIEKGLPDLNLNYWGEQEAVEAGVSVPITEKALIALERPGPKSEKYEIPIFGAETPQEIADGLWIRRRSYLVDESHARSSAGPPPFVDGIEKLESQDYEGAAKALEKAVEQDSFDAEAYYWLGVAKIRLGKPDQAVSALMRACLLKVDNVEYRQELANAYNASGKIKEADMTLREVLKLDPENEKALQLLGEIKK